MKKKYIFLFALTLIGSDLYSSDEFEETMTFTEQVALVSKIVSKAFDTCHNTFLYGKRLSMALYHEYIESQALAKSLASQELSSKSVENLDKIHDNKSKNSYIQITTTQKCVIALSAAAIISAVILYKYGFFSKQEVGITEQQLKKLVESVISDSTIMPEERLRKILELLTAYEINNCVIYNDHVFEVNDLYRVDISTDQIKIDRL